MDGISLVPCACLCGELMAPTDSRGRPRRFIHGHGSRMQPNKRIEVQCAHCGAKFERPQWHAKRVARHFCNNACEGAHATETGSRRGMANGAYNSVTVACSGCQQPVTKAHSLVYRRNHRVYCADCTHLCRKGRRGFYVDYPAEFSAQLRREIRKRDGYTCQYCQAPQAQTGTLHVHHIDYDKHNNDRSNLIALCRKCHGQSNYGTEQWQAYYEAVMAAR